MGFLVGFFFRGTSGNTSFRDTDGCIIHGSRLLYRD